MKTYDEFLDSLNELEFFEVLQIEREENARAEVIKIYKEYRMSPEQLCNISHEMAQRDANDDHHSQFKE